MDLDSRRIRTPSRSRLGAASLLAGLALLPALGCETDAEPLGERTVTFPIAYGAGSNWGPTAATGTVTIDTVTGRIETTVQGLPMLAGELYEGWLFGGDESPTTTGRFNTDALGDGTDVFSMGDISDLTFTHFVLTVEPEPDGSPAPDPRHSLGGLIPPAR